MRRDAKGIRKSIACTPNLEEESTTKAQNDAIIILVNSLIGKGINVTTKSMFTKISEVSLGVRLAVLGPEEKALNHMGVSM